MIEHEVFEDYMGPDNPSSPSTPSRPSAIYVWLVPSEEVLEQPGSWRIRKWDTEPFPEANFALSAVGGTEPVAWLYEAEGFSPAFSKHRLPMDRLFGNPTETPLYAAPQSAVSASGPSVSREDMAKLEESLNEVNRVANLVADTQPVWSRHLKNVWMAAVVESLGFRIVSSSDRTATPQASGSSEHIKDSANPAVVAPASTRSKV